MHKFRKLLILLLFPLVMFSCGMNKYYGYYAFQLGPDKGDHFGFYLDLTKKDYTGEDPEGAGKKEFKFGMRVSESMVPGLPELPDPIPEDFDYKGYFEQAFVYSLVQLLNTESDPDAGVTGYYSIGTKDIGDKGRKLDLTIVLTLLDLPPELMQKLIIAYVDGKNVSAILPVSLDSFRYQLAWYGLYISFDFDLSTTDPIEVISLKDDIEYNEGDRFPGPVDDEERLGTHPSEKDIDKMNEYFNSTDGKYKDKVKVDPRKIEGWGKNWFKDWNTLTVTLLKK